jgi:hypothetical protein
MNINGLIRFILEKKEYEKSYLVLEDGGDFNRDHSEYKKLRELMYHDDPRITAISETEYHNLCASGTNFDIVDTRHPGEAGSRNPPHNGKTYSCYNPIFESQNVSVDEAENTKYYTHHNVNKEVKLEYFYFQRKVDLEEDLYNKIVVQNPYSVICEYGDNLIDKKYLKYDKIINLHNISPIFFDVIKIIEESDDIHLIENSISLFVYHMQYKNLMKLNKINLHTYSRKESHRSCNGPNCNNKFLNMIMNPPLQNWEFIY